jgi:L-ascorbate metabolism protein UlaG (beta-lactamase superfamily)
MRRCFRIGAHEPAGFMSKQHLNPEEALGAHADLAARMLVGMHWGTFQLTDEPLDEPPTRLRREWRRPGSRCQSRPSAAR